MAKTEPASFGTLLLRLRAAAGLTQEQLAARAGLSIEAIAALERGKRRAPRAVTVELLTQALGLDADARAHLAQAAQETSLTSRSRSGLGVRNGSVSDAPRSTWWQVAQATPLVGRSQELDIILRWLGDEEVRLLTLTGPAGVGKTRLAVAAAARLAESAAGADRFPDRIDFVDLTPVREPVLVLNSLANALGLLDMGSQRLLERLVEVLRDRRQLVVLDNFEQVQPAAASLAELLAACPGLALLVTSRIPLRLRWEQTLRVAPLPVPDLTAPLPPLAELTAIPSIALFVQRARARQADFMLSEKHAPAVAQLVAELDGLPLALELAAARTDTLTLPMIASRLGDRLHLLRWEAADVPVRQQSLEAAVGWSYDLLSEDERRLFRYLGVFVGRVALDAIAAVVAGHSAHGTGAPDTGDTLQWLASLAEKSLILPERANEEDEDAEPGFGMLETVREYAWEQLAAAGEREAAQRAHAHYFLGLAEHTDPQLRGRDARTWFLRLEREHANLRAALRWLLDQDGPDGPAEREAGLRLAGALGYFWWARGYHAEGVSWLEEALRRAPQGEVDPAVRTRALIAAGLLLMYGGELGRALSALEEALILAQQRQEAASMARARTYLGMRAVMAGDMAEAVRLLEEARDQWDALGELFHLGQTRLALGGVAFAQGDYAQAKALQEAALQRLDAVGETRLAGFVHCYHAVVVWQQGDLLSAVAQLRTGLENSVTLRDRWLLSSGARIAVALVGVHADAARCARLLGAADALSQATGATLSMYERLPTYPTIAPLRTRLERDGWGAAYREGRALPFGEVVALALSLLEDVAQTLTQPEAVPHAAPEHASGPSTSAAEDVSPLSAREAEVLRLVAQGHSSKTIGQQLFLSPSTVNQHVKAIFNKLGVDTRAQAVAVAAQRGLL